MTSAIPVGVLFAFLFAFMCLMMYAGYLGYREDHQPTEAE